MKLNIGILGSRGIPNQYGGFEQFAEYLSAGLVERGHNVSVYNPHLHSYKQKKWKGVDIIHCKDPEYILGTVGQFVYDLNCLRDARRRNFDILLILGYTSSSVWGSFFPSNSITITNMDGLEWKRTKYIKPVRWFIQLAERLAVKYSDYLIADSKAIQEYLLKKFNKHSAFIAYGASANETFDESILTGYNVEREKYYMLMARMEPENNIEIILDGFANSSSSYKFLVIGNYKNKFGKRLKHKYKDDKRILFCGAVYNDKHVHNLRRFADLYFHGHSVGGTNPSLLEAMASQALIVAHDNPFNKAILGNNAYYFSTAGDVTQLINGFTANTKDNEMIARNLSVIKNEYSWEKIISEYEGFFIECCKRNLPNDPANLKK